MGCGESYIDKRGKWLQSLDEGEEEEYKELFPEPVTWKGYWNKEFERDCYERGEFIVELWREQGIPKYSVEQVRFVDEEIREKIMIKVSKRNAYETDCR